LYTGEHVVKVVFAPRLRNPVWQCLLKHLGDNLFWYGNGLRWLGAGDGLRSACGRRFRGR
jgi:hypothetical protein